MPRRESRIAGAVLAGGASRRLGGIPKGKIRLDGVPLLQRTVELLAGLFEEVILVANGPEALPGGVAAGAGAGAAAGAGPAARAGSPVGIQAGLARTSREAVLFVACDMPFLQPRLIRRLARGFLETDCEILLPRIGDLDEPLHAVYHTALAGRLQRQLVEGGSLSIRALFAQSRTCHLDLADTPANRRAFFNLNTPADLCRLEEEGWTVDIGEGEEGRCQYQ